MIGRAMKARQPLSWWVAIAMFDDHMALHVKMCGLCAVLVELIENFRLCINGNVDTCNLVQGVAR